MVISNQSYKPRYELFNREKNECRWPTELRRNDIVSNCNFNIEDLQTLESTNDGNLKIVKLPKGTKIYRKTSERRIKKGKEITIERLWETQYPVNPKRGGVYFSTSVPHIHKNINGTHLLEYKTKKNIYLAYVRNINQYCNAIHGNDFISNPNCYLQLLKRIQRESQYKVSGYIGCNECELFLHNEIIPGLIDMKPLNVYEYSYKFMD